MIFKLRKFIEKFFSWFSLFILLSMLGIIVLQVILRNFFTKSLNVASEVARLEVIWLIFTGGVLATLKSKHIAIDLMSKILPQKLHRPLYILLNIVAAIICGFLAWFSVNFVKMEIEFSSKIADLIPAWTFELIIPIGFIFIGISFILNIFQEEKECI